MMKKTDLTTHNATELQTMLEQARGRVAQYRFDLADKKLKRTSDIAATRRLIARLLTALKAKS